MAGERTGSESVDEAGQRRRAQSRLGEELRRFREQPTPSLKAVVIGGVHLAVLWAFAFAQPLLDLLSKNAEFFVARGNESIDIVVFALGLTLLPPLAMLLVELVAVRISPALRGAIHFLLVAGLVAALALQILPTISASAAAAISIALLLGVVGAWAYRATKFVPALLSLLAPAPLLFLALFLVFSPVSELVFSDDEQLVAPVERADKAPIVMLVFDELPASALMNDRLEIDASKYPSFAELAKGSTWYRNTATVGASTTQAIPAMLSGELPTEDALPTASDYPANLFTLFGAEETTPTVVETATSLCPEELCTASSPESFGTRMGALIADTSVVSRYLLLPENLWYRLPAIDTAFSGFAGGGDEGTEEVGSEANAFQEIEDRTPEFDRFIDGIQSTEKSLSFGHVQLPHSPYVFLPSGKRYPDAVPELGDIAPGDRWIDDQRLVDQLQQRELLQIGYADLLLGQTIAKLKELGIWESAMFVVASDHGASFTAGGFRRSPTTENLHAIGNVPLFVREPGQTRAAVDDAPICTTQLLTLIADGLEAELPIEPTECGTTVRIYGPEDPEGVATSFADWEVARDDLVKRLGSVFGHGRGWNSVYRWGPAANLIGNPPARVSADSGVGRVVLTNGARLDDVDLASKVIPAMVDGKLIDSDVSAGDFLAVSVNGTVAATSYAHDVNGVLAFMAVVPPRYLSDGDNELEVFRVVSASGSQEQLEPLPIRD